MKIKGEISQNSTLQNNGHHFRARESPKKPIDTILKITN